MSTNTVIADRRLCATAAGEICEASDERAAFLIAGAGSPIPAEHLDKVLEFLGAVEADEPSSDDSADADADDAAAAQADADAAAAAADAETKQAGKPADKQAKAAENK